MKTFFSCMLIGVLVLVCGCAAFRHGDPEAEDIAYIFKIEKISDPKPGYLVNAEVFRESADKTYPLHNVLVDAGLTGGAELQNKSTEPDFVMNTNSFGPVVCSSGRGIRYLVEINETPEKDMVKVRFFVLSVLDGENGVISVRHVDVPSVVVPLNKKIILFKQDGKVTHCNVDGADGRKIKFEFVNE